MTNQERAEKIAEEYCEGEFTSEKYDKFIVYLTSQLDVAQLEVLEQNEVIVRMRIDEAVKGKQCEADEREAQWCFECGLESQEKARAEGFASAREQAAGIAENEPISILRSQSHEGLRLSISERIRAMSLEEKR